MTCREFAPDIVDLARGEPFDPDRREAVSRHLTSCAECTARFERERAMSTALRRLAAHQTLEAIQSSNVQLQKLLATFDATRQRPRRIRVALEWTLAAGVVIVAGLAAGWKTVNVTPGAGVSERIAATTPTPPANAGSAFVVLPGADALPRFEHGQIVQIDIPSAAGVVRAEVLIGQDGLARAARLVQ